MYNIEEYKNILKQKLGEKRYNHCINVSIEAVKLAKKYGADVKKAEITGLLHDITKETDSKEQMELIKSAGIEPSDLEKKAEKTWHAISGCAFVKDKLNIHDKDILNSIRYHTIARENMSLLEKIIFIADFISEERTYEGVEKIRKAATIGIEEAMVAATRFSTEVLMKNGRQLSLETVKAYNEAVLKLNDGRVNYI